VDHARTALGDVPFHECAASGAAMEPADAVSYARRQIQLERRQPGDS
jgi:hypothetical protein